MAVRKATSVHFSRKGPKGDDGTPGTDGSDGRDAVVLEATPAAVVFNRDTQGGHTVDVALRVYEGDTQLTLGTDYSVVSAETPIGWHGRLGCAWINQGQSLRLLLLPETVDGQSVYNPLDTTVTIVFAVRGVRRTLNLIVTTVGNGAQGQTGTGAQVNTAALHRPSVADCRNMAALHPDDRVLCDSDGTTAAPWVCTLTQQALSTRGGSVTNTFSCERGENNALWLTAEDRHVWTAGPTAWTDNGELQGTAGRDAVSFLISPPSVSLFCNPAQAQRVQITVSCHKGGEAVPYGQWTLTPPTGVNDAQGNPVVTFAQTSDTLTLTLAAGKTHQGVFPFKARLDGTEYDLSISLAVSDRAAVVRTIDWEAVPKDTEIQSGAPGQRYIDAVVHRLGTTPRIYLCVLSFSKSSEAGTPFGLDTENNNTGARAANWEAQSYTAFTATKLLLADRIQSQYIDVASLIVGKLVAMLGDNTLIAVNREGRGEIISYYKQGEEYYEPDGTLTACPPRADGSPCLVADKGVIRRYDFDGNVVATFGLGDPSQQVRPSWLKRQVYELAHGSTAYTPNAIRTSEPLTSNHTVYLYQRGNTGTNLHPQGWCGEGATYSAYTGCFTDTGVPFMDDQGQSYRKIYVYANGVLQRTNTLSWNPM